MTIPADIVLTIAEPPSANAMYRSVKGRAIKSRVYREWKERQTLAVAHQLGGAGLPGHYAVAALLPPSRKDLDNRYKGISDVMQEAGAVKNDQLCMKMSLTVDPLREPGSVLVHLWTVDAPAQPKRARKKAAA